MSEARIALTHASSLLAQGIIEALVESGIAPDSVVLLDESEQTGVRVPFADTHLTVLDQQDYDYEGIEAILMTQKDEHLADLLQHADSYLIGHELNVAGMPRWFGHGEERQETLIKPAAVKLADAAQSTLLEVVAAWSGLATISRLSVVNVLSAGSFGKAAVDELASQTISLLNSRDVDGKLFPEQMAFNMMPLEIDSNAAAQLAALMGDSAIRCEVHNMLVAAFHGLAIAVALEFDEAISLEEARARLGQVSGLKLANGVVSPISHCKEGNVVHVFGLEQTQNDAKRLQFWIIADSIRNGLVKNYLNAIQVLLNSLL